MGWGWGNQAAIFCQVLYIVTSDKDHRVESQPVIQEGSGDLQSCSALRWKPEGPERDECLFLRSRCNWGHVMREEQSAGADLRFQPWLCRLTSSRSSDKSLLSASQDFSAIRQRTYVTLIPMVLFQLRFTGLAGS